jgi:uncharacterized protein with ParB-like and HNH nuclease domain
MKANYLPIQKVFDKHTVFEIPYYQRSYVWGEDNWARFLEDMEDVSKSERQFSKVKSSLSAFDKP